MFRFIQKVRQNRTGWSASRLRPPGMRLRRLIPHAAAVLLAVSVASTMLWAANTTVAGIVAGQLSVDSIGGANYDLPLEVAPGVNDLTPTLSLSYNSRIRTNGILGVGWTLNGLSTIYRCSKSQQLDGTVAPLENNNADRLCVDGARLIASTGASDSQYWSTGARYHTYEESWVRYTPVSGSFTHGPGSFTAKTRDGNTLTYGEAATGGTYGAGRWHLTQIKDRNNNQINISYLNTGGTERPNEITYNGHKIKFIYAAANVYNKEIFYTTTGPNGSGDLKSSEYRLNRVEMYANGSLFKTYKFTYKSSDSSKRYLITKIEECSAVDGGECLEPINISWNEFNFHGSTGGNFRRYQPGVETSGDTYQFDLIGLTNLPYGQFNGARLYPGDFDGDGLSDFIALRQHNGSTGGTESFCVYYANSSTKSDGTFSRACPTGTYKDSTNTNRSYQDTIRGRTDNGEGVNLALGDFNGDGRMDFLRQEYGGWANDSTNTFNVFLSNGQQDGTFTVTNPTNDSIQSKLKGTHSGSLNGVYLIVGDYNGDGNADFMAQQHGSWGSGGSNGANLVVYISNGSGGFTTATPSGQGEIMTGGIPGDQSTSGTRLIPGDYNGDGRTDFIRQEFGSWAADHDSSFRVYFSNGNGQFTAVNPATNSDYQKYLKGAHGSSNQGVNIFPGDFNGDGRTDFISQRYGDWADNTSDGKWKTFQVWLSKGNGYFEEKTPFNSQSSQLPFIGTSSAEGYLTCYGSCQFQTPVTLTEDGAFLRIADLNGDGKDDVIRQDDDTGFKLYYARGDGLFDNALTPSGTDYQSDLEPGKVFLTLGDYDGDGRVDFLKQEYGSEVFDFGALSYTYDNNFAVYLSPANYHEYPQPYETVKHITEGKLRQEITYGLMADPLVDPSGGTLSATGGSSNFSQPLNSPTWLVTQIREVPLSTGAPASRRAEYSYGTPVGGNEGGFLGFREISIHEVEKQILTRNTYEFHALDTFRAGRPDHTFVYNSKGTTDTGDDVLMRYAPLRGWSLQKGHLTGSGNSTYLMRQFAQWNFDYEHANGSLWMHEANITSDSKLNPILIAESYSGYAGTPTVYTCTNYNVNTAEGTWVLDQVKDRTVASSCTASGNTCSCSGTIFSKVAYIYDSNGNVTQERDHYNASSYLTTTYSNYDSRGLPGRITEPSGLRWDHTYDSNGFPNLSTLGTGAQALTTDFDYDPKWGLETSQTDPNNRVFSRTYDAFGRPKTISAPDNSGNSAVRQSMSYAWSGNNFVEQTNINVNWNGARVRTEKAFTDAYGNLRKTEVSSSDSGEGTISTFYEYNLRDQKTRESLPKLSGTTRWVTYTYSGSYHRLTGVDRPTGADSTISYATGGVCGSREQQVTETRNASEGNRVTVTCYDIQDRETRRQFNASEGNKAQTWQFDSIGRVTQESDVLTTTTTTYDSLSRVTEIYNTQRGYEKYFYNNNSSMGGMLHYVEYYDTDNKKTGREKTHFIDSLKRPTLIGRDVYDPASGASLSQRRVSMTYDQAGDCAGFANAKGRLCRSYVERQIGGGAFTKLLTRIYGYDTRGNVKSLSTKLEQHNKTYTMQYQYNRMENIGKVTFPAGRVVNYTYDHMGRIWQAGTSGPRATYTNYSATDRPGTVTLGNGAVENRIYDAYNRLGVVNIMKSGSSILWHGLSYTNFSEINTVSGTTGGQSVYYNFDYNDWGFIKQAQSTGTGNYGTLNYSYDSHARLSQKDGGTYSYVTGGHKVTSHTAGLTNVHYNKTGSVVSKTKNGITYNFAYDHNQQLLEAKRAGVTVAKFEYDANGDRWMKEDADGTLHFYITSELEAQKQGGTWSHTEYTHGPDGPIAADTKSGAGTALHMMEQHTRHQMLASLMDTGTVTGGASFLYHTAGMLITHPSVPAAGTLFLMLLTGFGIAAFVWSYWRSARIGGLLGNFRVRSAYALAGAGILNNGQAYRLAKTSGSSFMRRRRFLSLALPLALVSMLNLQCSSNEQELDGAAVPAGEMLGLLGFASTLGEPVAGTTRYFHSNQVGNVRLVTDGSGNITSKPVYKPFGELHTPGGTDDYRYKFQGKERDNETGLYYFGARYYDPDMGRFIQADTMSMGGSFPQAATMDRYAAFGNNPVNYADPTGNFFIFFLPVIVQVALAIAVINFAVIATTAAIQANASGSKMNWKRVMKEWAIGTAISLAVVGVAAGLGPAVWAASPHAAVALGFGLEFGASAATQAALYGSVDPGAAATDAFIGLALGGVPSGGAARGVSKSASARGTTRGPKSVGGCTCFAAGTSVETEDGPKAIEEIQVGDKVLSRKDDATGETEYKTVKELIRTPNNEVGELGVSAGPLADANTRPTKQEPDETLKVTADHPFYVPGRGWVEAKNLRYGDQVVDAKERRLSVSSVWVRTGTTTTYNFEVADHHTYYVGEAQIWVHNVCPLKPKTRAAAKADVFQKKHGFPQKDHRTGKRIRRAVERLGVGPTGDGIHAAGQFGHDSIPGVPNRNFTAAMKKANTANGLKNGCHRCGIKTPGTKSGHFILDHVPALSAFKGKLGQYDPKIHRLFPHCAACSSLQGGQLSKAASSSP